VRSVKCGGVQSWHPQEGPISGDRWCKDIGKGGGEADGEGGHDRIGSEIVRACGEGRRIGNSRAPCVKGSTGFPSPQYESSAPVP
jgi:hypothetical protein